MHEAQPQPFGARDPDDGGIVREMSGAADLLVPLAVNVAIGANWNDAHA